MQTEMAPAVETLPTNAVPTSATCPQCGTTYRGIWRTPVMVVHDDLVFEPELFECPHCEKHRGYPYLFRATPKVFERKDDHELDPELSSSDAMRLRLFETDRRQSSGTHRN